MIDADMRAVIDGQRLCYAATVTPDGRPSLSPRTRANLALNPWIETTSSTRCPGAGTASSGARRSTPRATCMSEDARAS